MKNSRRHCSVASILTTALFAAACSGVLERGVLVAEGEVDRAGGAISSKEGDVALSVPAGAVETRTEIRVRKIDPETLPEGVVPNTVVEFDPDGTRFGKPVELALRYSVGDLPNPESRWLRIVQLMPDGTLGQTQFLAHDRAAQQVTAKLVHFSSYAIADLEVAQARFESSEERTNQVDLLVLVDDSLSMLGEQQSLTDNFPRLADKLDAAGLDYRVGVISPNLGAGPYSIQSCETFGGLGGRLQATPRESGCTPPADPWIESHGAQSNVPGGDVRAAFSCIAKLGSDGCGFEQTLEAVYRAVDPAVNPGFIRNDAALALLLLTDEDDCSARDTTLYNALDSSLGPTKWRCFAQGVQCAGVNQDEAPEPGPRSDCEPREDGYLHPVGRYVDRLRALKPEGKVVVSLVSGPPTSVAVQTLEGIGPAGEPGPDIAPSCSRTLSGEEAFPAIRLQAFAEAFGVDRSSFTSVCADDFSPALDQIGNLVVRANDLKWCLPYDPEDTNSATTEVEADCVFEAGPLGEIPACHNDDSGPCYQVTRNGVCPNSASQIELRNAQPEDPGQDAVQVTCLVP